jgi:glycosyltransferase involved in cell wall biosynthesis
MSRVRVVVPVHQRPEWLAVCLRSLELQDQPAFDVTVVDDASPDPAVEAVARSFADRNGWTVVRSEERQEALASRCAGIAAAAPADDDVVVFVDGDDWLVHAGALRAVAEAMTDDVWITSGGMVSIASTPTRAERARSLDALLRERRAAFEADRDAVVAEARYRRMPWCWSHPIAFRAFLWRHIDPADFRVGSGRWIRTSGDLAYTFPLLELAGGRVALLDEVHYAYHLHDGNLDADPRRLRGKALTRSLLASRPAYRPLDPAPARP